MPPVSAAKTERSTSSVLRLRTLTPMIRASAATARSISSAVWVSTSTFMPSSRLRAVNSRSWASESEATISRIRSAPCARASQIWYSSTMKSLRSSGMSTAARTASRSAREPPKRRSSVRTLITAAPPSAYCAARDAGSAMSASWPLDGLRRLTSAITLSWSRLLEVPPRAAQASRAGAAAAARSFSSASVTKRWRACISSLTPALMSSRTLTFSGRSSSACCRRRRSRPYAWPSRRRRRWTQRRRRPASRSRKSTRPGCCRDPALRCDRRRRRRPSAQRTWMRKQWLCSLKSPQDEYCLHSAIFWLCVLAALPVAWLVALLAAPVTGSGGVVAAGQTVPAVNLVRGGSRRIAASCSPARGRPGGGRVIFGAALPVAASRHDRQGAEAQQGTGDDGEDGEHCDVHLHAAAADSSGGRDRSLRRGQRVRQYDGCRGDDARGREEDDRRDDPAGHAAGDGGRETAGEGHKRQGSHGGGSLAALDLQAVLACHGRAELRGIEVHGEPGLGGGPEHGKGQGSDHQDQGGLAGPARDGGPLGALHSGLHGVLGGGFRLPHQDSAPESGTESVTASPLMLCSDLAVCTARSGAAALFTVSWASVGFTESATIPPPAWTYARPSRSRADRMAIAMSMSPAKSRYPTTPP